MENFASFIKDLETLISFDSKKEPATPDAPFGEAVKNALDFFLKRAKEMGFETINYDNYVGEVVFGEGEEIGIIGHLDIVPAGTGWQTNPFTLTEKDGFLYGRGISDDKTPLLLSLYLLKEIKDSGIIPNRKIRLFAGCDEESGWKDIKYLQTKTTLPEYGFSPDGNFPVMYAEKGMYEVEFCLPMLKNFKNLSGGTVVNAVCAYAKAQANSDGINEALLKKHGLTVNGDVIESVGVSAHGSAPQLGKNALKPLFEYFLALGEDVKNLLDCLFYDLKKVSILNTEQGFVTFSPDLIREENGKIYITCDCRIPAPLTIDDVKKVFDTFGIPYNVIERHPPMMVEKDGWFVDALLSAYNTVTGKSEKPVSMGGSTFARAFKKGCAFGPDFNTYNNCVHNANERLSIEDIHSAYNIYKLAVINLIK